MTEPDDATVDLETFRTEARAWIHANLEPAAGPPTTPERWTPELLAPERALQRRIFDGGFAGIAWPAEYGGRGLTPSHERVFQQEAAAFRTPRFGIAGQTTFDICIPTMLGCASPEFLRRHVPRVLAGDELWVQFYSEPQAGSDLAGVRSSAVREDGGWRLNGAKMWSSAAYYADYGMCLVRTDWTVPKHRGLTWFAVPIQAPGVEVRMIRQIDDRAELCQEFFDDVRLDDADVIGDVNGGWPITRRLLALERGGGSRAESGRTATPAREFPDDLVALATAAGRLGDPHVRELIATAHVNDRVYDAVMRRVVALGRAGGRDSASVASYGKLLRGTFTPLRARMALEIGGAAAATWDPAAPVGPAGAAVFAYLNCRMPSIAGGTNEMQRNAISEQILGLPREPSYDSARPYAEVLRDIDSWQNGPKGDQA
ncbi:acyl-CoA dehydrogenase family protein [Pseudofrankia inefficax]|uniref:Acyl-CoA dehydrogenase domain-containing protein n=1 Tax=Pseudofrankia inefficax (strain DSM 45817 / CECT 9037 / DDB 130130 / EuI1c) TaxID=298654 RepID=E3IU55_PSEI1|nr:acyl-CoA dehydrogenase family protein [Pseudofrankia inefficax]ADP81248.1 acyl-CoA dehydrogenase domain-containing protein [Pseudofrankia inefficax]